MDDSTAKAAKVADLMQTAAKMIVLLLIIPAAVLIAVYYITEPLIPVAVTRQMFSASFALCLAGLLVVRTRGPVLGSLLILAGCAVSAWTLSSYWNTLYASVACLHGFMIVTLFTVHSLTGRGILAGPRIRAVRGFLVAWVVLTGPAIGTSYAISSHLEMSVGISITLILLVVYILALQFYLKEPRLGIVSSITLSFIAAITWAPALCDFSPVILLIGSSFVFVFGIVLVAASQSLRIIRNLAAKRPIRKRREAADSQRLLQPMSNIPEEIEPEHTDEERRGEWIIDPDHAHAASGFGVFLTALGIPANFLSRAGSTGWGLDQSFQLLFVPLALLITLLVLIPAPVFLRLGQIIGRSTESTLARAIGVVIIIAATFSTYQWTQFAQWSTETSLIASILMAIAGATGLFKEIRRLWKRAWSGIVRSIHALNRWIISYPIRTGAVVDMFLTLLVVCVMYRLFGQYPRPYFGLVTLSLAVFCLIALLGLAAMIPFEKRKRLAALAWTLFLCSGAAFSFWYLIDAMLSPLVDAAFAAAIWMLGTGLLLRLGVQRKVSALPYAIGIVGMAYSFRNFEATVFGTLNDLVLIGVACVFTIPFLHKEYSAALSWLRVVLVRAWEGFARAVSAAAAAVHRALVRVGTTIYRGVVFIGVMLVKFLLLTYGILLMTGVFYLGYGILLPAYGYDIFMVVVAAAALFFIMYAPMVGYKRAGRPRLVASFVVGFATSIGLCVFLNLARADPTTIDTSLLMSITLAMGMVTALRSVFPERIRLALPLALYLTLLSYVSVSVFRWAMTSQLLPVAAALAGIPLATGLLAAGASKRFRRIAKVAYSVVIGPSSFVLWYALFADIVLMPLLLLIVLTPTAYPYYVRALRTMLTFATNALRAFRALVLANLVVVFAVVALGAVMVGFQFLQTFFDAFLYKDLARILFFALMFMVIWTPSVFARQDTHRPLLSALVVGLSICSALYVVISIQPAEAILTVLIGFVIATFMLTIFSSAIKTMLSRRIPLTATLLSFLALIIHLVALDFILELLLTSFGTIMVTVLLVGRTAALRFVYPIATLAGLGAFFYVFVLPLADPFLALIMYVTAEALMLSAVKYTYRWVTWVVFSVATSFLLFYVLSQFTQASVFLACWAGLELLRVTPSQSRYFSILKNVAGAARAILFGMFAGLLIGGYVSLLLCAALSVTIILVVFRVSLGEKPASNLTLLIEDTIAAALSVVTLEITAFLSGGYNILVFYLAAVPILCQLVSRVQSGKRALEHFYALTAILVLMAGTFWSMLGYASLDSLPLVLSSGFAAAAILNCKRPSSLPLDATSRILAATALIVLFETVWTWHALLVFSLSGQVVLVGAGLVLVATFLYPASSGLNWLKFEFVWDFVSVLNAITLGALISGWDIFTGPVPPYPLLTLGWSLSLYSLLSTPVSLAAQRKLTLSHSESTGHMNWAISMAGWPFVAWSYASTSSLQPQTQFGLTALAFCGAAGVYLALHPDRTGSMVDGLNLGVATTFAYLFWISGFIAQDLIALRLGLSIVIWYLVLIRITLTLTKKAARAATEFVLAHANIFALVSPPLIGLVLSLVVIKYESTPILGIAARNILVAMGLGSFVAGVGWILGRGVADLVKKAGVTFTFFGFCAGLVSLLMPAVFTTIEEISYVFLLCLTLSLLMLSGLGKALHLPRTMHASHALGGVTAGMTTYLGVTLYWTLITASAVFKALLVAFLIEAPLLREQIAAFVHMLKRLGTLIVAAVHRLGAYIRSLVLRLASYLKALIQHFGYIMWTLFSLAFVLGLGYLSYPFFSQLLSMQVGSPLYIMPSFSMPTMLLGLLLVTVTVVRRRVKTRFGAVSLLTALIGGGLTGVVWLLDEGVLLLAVALAVIMFSMILTAVNRSRSTGINRVAASWIPTPLACGLALYSFMNPLAANLSYQALAAGLSVMVASILLVASERIDLMPERSAKYLLVVIAFTSGGITYACADLALWPDLAKVYLSVFVISWMILPLARREWIHLFYAPLFFSLTGFAFTFVFGELAQSLLLAVAAFLLFISLLVRDREKTRPRLVYARLAILIALASCIALFGVITWLSFMAMT